ncbi:hypothetical protein [Streptomyces sp. NPDC102437]
MEHLRTVDDVMTHAVVTVSRRAPFKDVSHARCRESWTSRRFESEAPA